MSTFVLTGPSGSGKTRLAADIAKQFGFTEIIEEWNPNKMKLSIGALHITNASFDSIRDKHPKVTILEIKKY